MLNALIHYMKTYHPMIHLMLLGSVFISLTNSMSIVFLPIYLINTSHIDAVSVGFLVGAGAITSTIGGFIGGTLSDLIGRNKLLLLALLGLSAVFLGFVMTRNMVFLLLANVLRGLFSSFFTTISKACIADFTPKEKRFKVFSNRYLAGNIGYSIGPIIGTVFGVGGNASAFLFTGFMYLGYFILIYLMIGICKIQEGTHTSIEIIGFKQAWDVFRVDRVLFLFIVGSIFLTAVHGEMSATLSQYLKSDIADGIKLFGYLMSLNGITVILTQVLITRWAEKFALMKRLALGSLLFTIGEFGFAFSQSWVGFVISMIIFTYGEILIIPSEYAQIDEITPIGMTGMYYGAQGFSEIGNFIGPCFGGYVLVSFGGKTMFLTFALFSLIGAAFYGWGRNMHLNKKQSLNSRSMGVLKTRSY